MGKRDGASMRLQHSRAMESRGTGDQDNGEVISTPLCELQNRWALRLTTRGMEGHKAGANGVGAANFCQWIAAQFHRRSKDILEE